MQPEAPSPPGGAPAGAVRRSPLRLRAGTACREPDWIAEEVPVALSFDGEPFAVMMATPADIADFALGFAVSEGIVDAADELRIEAIDATLDGIHVAMSVPAARHGRIAARRRGLEGRSGCGLCGAQSIEAVLRPPRPVPRGTGATPQALARALDEMQRRQTLNALTGATHAAAWAAPDGRLLVVREDVGRHNALDKLVGALLAAGTDLAAGFCVVSSRASYEMAMKAAQAGMPMLAAISAPTALAVSLADSAGMTLVGFARGESCVVYTHPWRLAGASVATSPP